MKNAFLSLSVGFLLITACATAPEIHKAENVFGFMTWSDPFLNVLHQFEVCLESKDLVSPSLDGEPIVLPGVLRIELDIDSGFKPLSAKLSFSTEADLAKRQASECVKKSNLSIFKIFAEYYATHLTKGATTAAGKWIATNAPTHKEGVRYDLSFTSSN